MSSSASHPPSLLRQFARSLLDSFPETEVRRALAGAPALEAIKRDPAQILTRAGMTPDPWQAALLRSTSDRLLMLASRQASIRAPARYATAIDRSP